MKKLIVQKSDQGVQIAFWCLSEFIIGCFAFDKKSHINSPIFIAEKEPLERSKPN